MYTFATEVAATTPEIDWSAVIGGWVMIILMVVGVFTLLKKMFRLIKR